MSFLLTLPSNASSAIFEGNSVSTFRTVLPRDVKMVGNYECGLCQITFPTDLINFTGGKIVFVQLEPVPIDQASPDDIFQCYTQY